MATSRIRVSGPLWDGRADDAVKDWVDKTKKDVTDYAMLELDAYVMDKTGRATGRYQEHMRNRKSGENILIDNPVVYGPWLEGVSRRNESTRFKGYRLWRKTRQRAARAYKDFADKNLKEYLNRMGGV